MTDELTSEDAPMIPDFDVVKVQNRLEEIETRFQTDKGIKTNSERLLIIAKKLCLRL